MTVQPEQASPHSGQDPDPSGASPHPRYAAPAPRYEPPLPRYASPEQYRPAPQNPAPRGGLPGWAIALILAGAVILLGAATGGALFASHVLSASPIRPAEVPGPPPPSDDEARGDRDDQLLRPVEPEFGAEPKADSDAENSAPGSASESARSIGERYDAYLAMWQDESIYELLPDGESVHPDYIAAFFYTLADYKSAARISEAFGQADDATELEELVEQTDALEKRFLAGEDLDVSVKITREDGSVFESDGAYRTID